MTLWWPGWLGLSGTAEQVAKGTRGSPCPGHWDGDRLRLDEAHGQNRAGRAGPQSPDTRATWWSKSIILCSWTGPGRAHMAVLNCMGNRVSEHVENILAVQAAQLT